MSTVPTVVEMKSMVPHTLNSCESATGKELTYSFDSCIDMMGIYRKEFSELLVVNDQEDGDQAIDMCKTFYDAVPDYPDYGGRQ